MLNILGAILAPAYVYGAFAVLFLLNVILGVISNCLLKSEHFEVKRIINSFLKILTGAVAMLSVIFAFELFATGLSAANISLDQSIENIITSGTFILLFIKGVKNAAIDVYTKTRDLFEIKDSTEFDTQAIADMKIQTTVNKDDMRIEGAVENEY